MGRYDTSTGIEGQTQPGSRGRVLRNLLGITRKTELDELEFRSLLAAQDAMNGRGVIGMLNCRRGRLSGLLRA